MKKAFELGPQELTNECDPSLFDFTTTDELVSETEMIGQERAVRAIDFGLNIQDEGFNLYISGVTGTGRNTAIINAVRALAKNKPAPEDVCFLYNFEKPDEPKFLKLPAGKGCELRLDMEEFIKDFKNQVQKSFSSEDYEKHKKEIIDRFQKHKEDLDAELDEFVKSKSFMLQQTLTGVAVIPLYKGHALGGQQYEKLPDSEKQAIKKSQDEVDNKLYENLRKTKELQRRIRIDLEKLDEDIGTYAIGHLIEDLKKKYAPLELVTKHLEDIKTDILNNLDAFKKETEPRLAQPFGDVMARDQDAALNKYKLNLLVDNCKSAGAPVIIEPNPTYYNLTGYVEYRAQFGVFTTDFTMIKPGSCLKAAGGYLILQAHQLLRDYFAWEALKKIIRYKKVKIENIAEQYGFIPTSGLKPEAVPIDLKVIIVGNPLFYHLLFIYDEDFRKLFKVKADFDTSVKKSEDFIKRYALFVARKCKEDKLLAFGKEAVAKVIDYASRLISHKEKLSVRFLEIVDLIKQADFWARKEGAAKVAPAHVKLALEEKIYRSNLTEKKIQELFEENTLFVDTEGTQVGQINGLSVIDLGDYSFGMPSRITVTTFLGKGNIVNIEREARLSGKIHSKGVLILSGFLGQRFAQNKPLALSANICFEQAYEGVEGDSASSTELYCLLSSLSDLPLRQDIAVTGSVNQRGKVQPVGGINEKIEGFFEVCKIKGITGAQGVIIPKENVKHLMLKEEVVEAVRESKFHIYPVETIEQGIEILTGVEAGELNKKGSYPAGSVFHKVDEKLSEYANLSVNFGKKKR